MYLLLWLGFFGLAFGLGFIGFTRMRLPPLAPPVAEGIPYSQYLLGGRFARDGVIELDPATIPKFNPARQQNHISFHVHNPSAAKSSRLVAIVRGSLITYGWPRLAFTYGSQQAWDVTDPSKPFAPYGEFYTRGGSWHANGINVLWFNNDGSLVRGLSLNTSGAIYLLALPQLIAALVVMASWSIANIQMRWRRKHRRCLHCGHGLDPARPAAPCPECGTAPSARSGAMIRPGLICVMLFAILIAVWIVMQFQHVTINRGSIEEHVVAAQSTGRSFAKAVPEESRGYGWPAHFIYVQVNHWYAFGGPQAVKVPSQHPLVSHDVGYLMLSIRQDDPSIASLWTIHWPPALLQLGLIQIIATLATMLILVAARMLCRKRRATTVP